MFSTKPHSPCCTGWPCDPFQCCCRPAVKHQPITLRIACSLMSRLQTTRPSSESSRQSICFACCSSAVTQAWRAVHMSSRMQALSSLQSYRVCLTSPPQSPVAQTNLCTDSCERIMPCSQTQHVSFNIPTNGIVNMQCLCTCCC